jgi:hypothetical protein
MKHNATGTKSEFTHRIPKNALGYFAMHCSDNQGLPAAATQKMVDGPLKAMQTKLSDELAGKNDAKLP